MDYVATPHEGFGQFVALSFQPPDDRGWIFWNGHQDAHP